MRDTPRWYAVRLRVGLLAVAALTTVGVSACTGGARTHWRAIDGKAFRPLHTHSTVTVLAIVAGQPWLAVGSEIDTTGQQTPRAWSSPDGRVWRNDPLQQSTVDGLSDALSGLARRDSVAVTAGQYPSPREGNLRPSMWWRDASGTWHEVRAPRELFGGERGAGLVDVAPTPSGFIVLGGWTGNNDRLDIGVWTSTAGTEWIHVDDPPALSPIDGEVITASSAAALSSGVVIVGDANTADSSRGIAWWSPDEHRWSRSTVAGAADLDRVVSTPAGAVVVGTDVEGRPASWQSDDGRYWTSLGTLPDPHHQPVTFTSTALQDDGVVAAGIVGGRTGRAGL